MDNNLIAGKVRGIAEIAVGGKDIAIVNVEVVGAKKKPILRIFIDHPEGVTHDHCSEVSVSVGEILDGEDFISSAYTLEVSSPGIERGLFSIGDFGEFAGSLARVKTRLPIDGQSNFRGRIIETDGEEILFEDNANGLVRFPFSEIVKANLEVDMNKELGASKGKRK